VLGVGLRLVGEPDVTKGADGTYGRAMAASSGAEGAVTTDANAAEVKLCQTYRDSAVGCNPMLGRSGDRQDVRTLTPMACAARASRSCGSDVRTVPSGSA
jgi:hypothetical protein